jgi:hypothetical protein
MRRDIFFVLFAGTDPREAASGKFPPPKIEKKEEKRKENRHFSEIELISEKESRKIFSLATYVS